MVRFAPLPNTIVDEISAGRLYKDGNLVGPLEALGVGERRKLSIAGHVVVSIILDPKGEILDDPDIELVGLPREDENGRPLVEAVLGAALETLNSLSRARRRDADSVGESVRRSVRAAVRDAWGKKPICTVFVAVV